MNRFATVSKRTNKIIIGIHGLGNKPSQKILTSSWEKAMVEGLNRIGSTLTLPHFRMIYWADVFNENPLTRYKKSPDDPFYLREPYTKAPLNYEMEDISVRQKILDYLGRQLNEVFLNEDLSLNYSYLTDLILKKYFRELSAYFHETCMDRNNIECMAKDLIRERVSQILQSHKDQDILFIGHSMGSIIAFDVLTFMVPDLRINTFVTMGSPLGLPIVISKIALEQKIHGEEEAIMKTPPGVERNWYNFSDIRDNIAFNYLLGDDFGPNTKGVRPLDQAIVNDYMIGDEKNPHKSFGYLRTSEFAKVLEQFIQDD